MIGPDPRSPTAREVFGLGDETLTAWQERRLWYAQAFQLM